MRALDLFCGAGGAAMGLHRAGFEVVGVDINPQPNYPFAFTLSDVWQVPVFGYDLIWASPPCQRFIRGGTVNKKGLPDLLTPVRELLIASGSPWIIENVPGAPMRADVELCGSMFDLPLRRHRWFELSWSFNSFVPPCDHSKPIVGVYGHPHGKRGAWPGMLPSTKETWELAMGIDWMTVKELSQAIPPAYSEFLARAML